MKKLLLAVLATTVLTGCGTQVEITRNYISDIPASKATDFAEWVDNCAVKELDKGMMASCYSLGVPLFSTKELHLKYTTRGSLGDYMYHYNVPCTTKTLTKKEQSLCKGEINIIVLKGE
jgi:hypothetical protein